MQRLFKFERDGKRMIFTEDQVLEELRTDLDEADPGDAISFPRVEAVVMTDEEYAALPESEGW